MYEPDEVSSLVDASPDVGGGKPVADIFLIAQFSLHSFEVSAQLVCVVLAQVVSESCPDFPQAQDLDNFANCQAEALQASTPHSNRVSNMLPSSLAALL